MHAIVRITLSVINRISASAHHGPIVAVLIFAFAAASPALAQTIAGDPGPNENIIGPTPDPADIRDLDSRQQTEVACAVDVGDSACKICVYNDYRTVGLFGDGWQGVSQTCGDDWTSRIAPGHPSHPAPVNGNFAADPRVIAIPGMAIVNFIAGFRDTNAGMLGIQHWLKMVREDTDHWEPGMYTYSVDEGTSGRFIDKPDELFVPDPPAIQGKIALSTVMENPELGTITREYPSGLLFVAYAVVTGSGNFKVLYKVSDDLGRTFKNQPVKLSEDQNTVSGISLTAIGDTVLATWRRQNDNNDFDSIMYAWITDRGKRATKGEVLADICAYDQATAASPFLVTFRTNDFPWAANDGKNFYIFYSRRDGIGASACASGRPRIVMNHARAANRTWQAMPMVIDANAPPYAFQFMPAAFGALGKVQVAWYDTRREGMLPADILDTSGTPQDPAVVADYISAAGNNVFRKVDVYTTRITSDPAGNIQPIPDPVRVSQFRIAAEVEDDELGPVAIEGEALFPNKKMYADGMYSFIGDYMSVSAEQYRFRADGKLESNASPLSDSLQEKVDFLVAWNDTRDVRGDVVSLDQPAPWSPPGGSAASNTDGGGSGEAGAETLLANNERIAGREKTTEGLDGSDTNPQVCTPGAGAYDRTRDANIYVSSVRDRVHLEARTPRKPINSLQRSMVVALASPVDAETTYRLEIANQPQPCAASTLCRASFRQQPSVPPFDGAPPPVLNELVTVPPGGSAFRTVFMTAPGNDAQVTVNAYDTDCSTNPACAVPVATIKLGGADDFQNPDYISELCLLGADDPACDVLRTEFHNPALINPALINPALINPALINPALINYLLENPALINPLLINTSILNYNLENPALINPALINPALINTNLVNAYLVNPALINPALINSTLDDGSLEPGLTWTDYNYYVQNTGNVTTAMNADITYAVPEGVDVDSQLIAWAPIITPTTLDCERRFQIEERIYGVANNVDSDFEVATINNPFNGDITGVVDAGDSIVFTLRVFGTEEELDTVKVTGFTASSQSANCTQDVPVGNNDDWFCEVTLEDQRERIRLQYDTTGPVFTNLTNGQTIPVPAQQANTPGGACLDPVATGIVTASDDSGNPVTITCTNTQGDEICVTANGGLPLPPDSTDLSFPVTNLLANPMPKGSPMTCTATDEAGNATVVNVFFEVLDTSAPYFTSFPPDIVSIDADPLSGTASYDIYNGVAAQDVDSVDPNPVISCSVDTTGSPADPLPAGSNLVTCEVKDASGNATEDTYTIVVNDVTFPIVTLNGANPQTVEAGQPYVELGAFATDNVALAGFVVIDASAVDTSTTGDYFVTYTATDTSGNTTVALRTVSVVDTTPPAFPAVPLDIVVSANGDGTATVTFGTPDATDNAGMPTVVCAPPSGSVFTIGTTVVTCTATDASGNTASVSFDVIVRDATPPVVSVPTEPLVVQLQGPDGAVVDYAGLVSATDNIDPSPLLECAPASGSLFGPGETIVSCTATDASGNSSTATFPVVVGYANSYGIIPNKLVSKSGSSNTLTWVWQDESGNAVDSSADRQHLRIVDCGNISRVILDMAGDPGSSGFRFKVDRYWEFNWQSVDVAGNPLPRGSYCASVESMLTGQTMQSPPIRLN